MLETAPPQGPQQDSGNAGVKKVLEALENDTKVNIQKDIPGKDIPCPHPSPPHWGPCTTGMLKTSASTKNKSLFACTPPPMSLFVTNFGYFPPPYPSNVILK